MERRQNFTYICYDNEAYMNTGIQRSSATPLSASTTTSPVGPAIVGKREWKKDLAGIAIAHGVDYVATASPAYWPDYLSKMKKAMDTEGPALIHVLAPCPLGWRFPTDQTIKLARLAVQTRYFPLYEVDHGNYKLTTKVLKPLPIEDFLRPQGRFQHLFKPENEAVLKELAQRVEDNWNRITRLCGIVAS
jgi:pyruvate ferredoxin oxidoreductase beta subunit